MGPDMPGEHGILEQRVHTRRCYFSRLPRPTEILKKKELVCRKVSRDVPWSNQKMPPDGETYMNVSLSLSTSDGGKLLSAGQDV